MSVTAAQGFSAAGIAAGIKESGKPGVALVVDNGPRRAAAGVFTSNRVKAAPVLWSERVLKGGEVTAVVLTTDADVPEPELDAAAREATRTTRANDLAADYVHENSAYSS